VTLLRSPLQRIARRIGRLRDDREESGKQLQWFLLAGWRDRADWPRPEPAALTPIYQPDDAFWADPFAWSDAGRHFVFFEEYPFRSRLGRISCIELGRDARPVGDATPILNEPRHLSYPFLFEHDDALYMVPESSSSERIDLYRCVAFPFQWRREGTLIAGIRAADATLFEHEGRWWLFCAARSGGAGFNESLFAFHASSPLSDRWVPHERNPLVRDYERGRPAGRIFRDQAGRLLRPSQNCVRRYGYGLNLGEITALSPQHFAERRVWRSTGPESGGWRAMHHLDWHDGLMVMDAQRLIPLVPD